MTIKEAPSRSAAFHVPATFRALRHRNYMLWFIGQGISLTGTWMQTMAQQVLVYKLTGSAISLGIVNFMALIPLIPLTLWGGSITDIFPKRTVILITQTGMLIQAVIQGVLTASGTIQVWHIYVLSLMLGIFNAVDMPARQAFTVDMVEGKEDLTNAIGLNSAMFNGARAIGPALAGLVVAATGEANAFYLNALSFVAVIISLLLMRNLPHSSHANSGNTNMIQHMAEGIRFTLKNEIVWVLTSLVAVSAFLSMPYNTLLPVYAGSVLKESAQPVVNAICGGTHPLIRCQTPEALPLGLLLTIIGVGALLGALVVASLPSKTHYGKWLTLGNLAFPALLVLMSLSSSFMFTLVVLLFVGVSFVWQNALANTMLQLVTPDELRGRVMGVFTLTFQGMMRLGGIQAGFLGDWLGPQLSVGIGAVLSLVYGIYVALRFRTVRKFEGK